MKHLKCLLLCALLGSASMQAAASCYTVHDPSGVVYHEATAPVDMSRPLHETVPVRFPGGHLIFDTDTDCANIVVTATTRTQSYRLLTDQQTALDMKLPYAMLGNGMALVWTGPRVSRTR